MERKQEGESRALRWNTFLHGRYLIGEVSGQGGFGITYTGWDRMCEKKVAVKEYFPEGKAARDKKTQQLIWRESGNGEEIRKDGCEVFRKEAEMMMQVDDLPGTVSFLDIFSENRTVYIVMEYVDGITLQNRLIHCESMAMCECGELLIPVIQCLKGIHGRGIIHRDICPDNIMISQNGHMKIVDFGSAVNVCKNTETEPVYRRGFSPPEKYDRNGRIGPWTDVYALCATIYYCIKKEVLPLSIERIEDDRICFEAREEQGVTKEVIKILQKGLELRTEKRWQSMDAVLAALQKSLE